MFPHFQAVVRNGTDRELVSRGRFAFGMGVNELFVIPPPPGFFVSADSKEVTGEFFVSADSKGVISPLFPADPRGARKCGL